MHLPIPEVTKREIVYQGYFDIRIDHLQSEKGAKMAYNCLDIKVHAAAVLAKTKEGKFLITQEYRHPTGQWILGCPGGRIDEGESPVQAGQRELKEETGYTGGKAILMGQVFSLPAVTDQIIHYIFIDGVQLTAKPHLESFEWIQTRLLSKEELFKEIQIGIPLDSVLCTALLLNQTL